MKPFIKIILTVIVSIVIYLLGLLPCYLLGVELIRPIDYFCSFAVGTFMWIPALAIIYFAYNIVKNIIK